MSSQRKFTFAISSPDEFLVLPVALFCLAPAPITGVEKDKKLSYRRDSARQ